MHTTLLTMFILATLIVACSGAPPASLDGREFIVVNLAADGVAQPLVPGTQIRISFNDGQIGANAGCNHLGGSYSLDGGRLLVGDLAMTEMGCDPERHAQDERLANFLASEPLVRIEGDVLVLEGGSVVATLRDRQSVEPDPPLVGTRWRLVSIIEGEAVRSVPDDVVSTIEFTDQGRVDVQPGCNRGGGAYETTDGMIAFGPIALTRMACPGAPDEVEQAVVGLLSGEVAYEVDAGALTLRAGDLGLQYRAG